MTLSPSDVVMIPFPYTDLKTSKRRLRVMYAMLEKKRQAPAPSAESLIQGLQEMGEEAQRSGLTPEILDDILHG